MAAGVEDLTYERVSLVKPEVFVYKVPPLSTNRGYRYVNLLYCTGLGTLGFLSCLGDQVDLRFKFQIHMLANFERNRSACCS